MKKTGPLHVSICLILERRFAGAPDKVKFLKGAMNVIDCLAIAPYFLTLFFMPPTELGALGDDDDLAVVQSPEVVAAAASEEPPEEDGGIGEVGRIMQVFRIARIMRIFKLARRSVGLQSIAYTVRTSWKGDIFLVLILMTFRFEKRPFFVTFVGTIQT